MLNSLILFFITSIVFSSECNLTDILLRPEIQENAQFWEDFGKLQSEKLTKKEIASVLEKKYNLKPQPKTEVTTTVATKTLDIDFSDKALKELEGYKGQKNITDKVDEFLEIIKIPGGMKKLKETGHSWNPEKMPQYGKDHWSVRVNKAYRILFTLYKDKVNIVAIDKDIGH